MTDNYRFGKIVPVLKTLSRRLTSNPHMGAEPSDLEEVLNAMLDASKELLGVDCAALWLVEDDRLKVAASNGLPEDYTSLELEIGQGITGSAVKHSAIQKSSCLLDDTRRVYQKSNRDSQSMMSVPICIGSKAVGSFNVYKKVKYDFNKEDEDVLEIITGLAAEALLLARRNSEAKNLVIELMYGLGKAFREKTGWTYEHVTRVTFDCMRTADKLDLSLELKRQTRDGAKMHDIGKFGIEDSILNKPDSLSDDEYLKIKQHPKLGVEIISNIRSIDYVIPAILDHHERLDGSGYPNKKKAGKIEIVPRIIAVADSWDAMMGRPYKMPMPYIIAFYDLCKLAGLKYNKEALAKYRAIEKIKISPNVSEEIKSKLVWCKTDNIEHILRCSDKVNKDIFDEFYKRDDGSRHAYDQDCVIAFGRTLVERNMVPENALNGQ